MQKSSGPLGFANPNMHKTISVESDVEKRLQAAVLKDRIRIKEFFHDFDHLRKGYVAESAFRTALGTLQIHLTAQEIESLIKKYGIGQGLVSYTAFCKGIEQVFEAGQDANAILANSKSNAIFTDAEKDQLMEALGEMRFQINTNRILLKPSFQDFDRANCCHITKDQFFRVLKKLNLFPADAQLSELIARKYFDKGNLKEVNYPSFCADVDKPEDMFPEYVAKRPVPAPVEREKGVGPASTFYANTTKDLNVLERRFGSQPINISNDPSDVEDRIKACVVMKRVRIEEFFRDFDKLRKGKVTPHQFKGILSMLNFQLTEEEFQSIIAKYRTEDNLFNHACFCANINKAFTQKGIDKDPSHTVKTVSAEDTTLARRKYLETTEQEHQLVEQLLEEYRKAIKVKRISMKPQFQGFDITKNGHVTKTQFIRVCAQLSIYAPDSLMNTLLKRYMDKGNIDEVNYVDFCNDVDTPQDIFGVGRDYNHSYNYFPRSTPHVTASDIVKHVPDNVEDILAKLRLRASEQRIRFHEFMRDFDKLRSGFITDSQFRIGLNMGKVVLSAAEFNLLCDHFKAPKEGKHVKWREFCDQVDEIFTKKGLERSVDIPLNDVNTKTFYGTQGASEFQKAQAQDLAERFRDLLIKNRLDAKSFFQDWDRHKHFKISPKQFRQVLSNFGFIITDEENQSIVKVYGNPQNEVIYMNFLNDADPAKVGEQPIERGPKAQYTGQELNFKGANAIDSLMKKIKEQCKKDRIRLLEFFQDHDILRKGYLPQQKFRSTLYSQKIYLTTEEYELLQKVFAHDIDPLMVNYVKFDHQIQQVFTLKDIEKDPTKTIAGFKAPSILDNRNELSQADEQLLDQAMQRIGTIIRHKRLLIKPFFQDKDKSKSSFIATSRFRSIFDMLQLKISDQEFALICKRFQAKAHNEINYVEFDHVMKRYSGDDQPV